MKPIYLKYIAVTVVVCLAAFAGSYYGLKKSIQSEREAELEARVRANAIFANVVTELNSHP